MDTELADSVESSAHLRSPAAAYPAWRSSPVERGVPVAEAARRLGVSRARIYALVERGQLDDVSDDQGGSLRISLTSIERRLTAAPTVGPPLSASSAWAVLALASGDPAFRVHVAGRLSDPDRSRAKARLQQHNLVELLPRLRGRATARRFAVSPAALVDLLGDAHLVLAGPSAARALGWDLPSSSYRVDAYVADAVLVDIVERYRLEPDTCGDVVLRSVPEPWPFPPHLRVAPDLVAAIDLADGSNAELIERGRARLRELTDDQANVSWPRRPARRRPVRPVIPSAPTSVALRRLRAPATQVWDDRAERDARGLVALLFVAARSLRRAELAEALHCSVARVARACEFLRASPPHGLVLLEHADQLQLVTAPDVGQLVEAFLNVGSPEPLSKAALEVLAIVAYEQPVSRSDISGMRGVDSSGAIDTLLARGLIADDQRFGGRGRPAFLVTTDWFLLSMGLASLAELPPRGTAM